ncbi:hypothetical protein SKUN_00716 [Spiroplasma kunkelii CR2-3x]|uniref:Spiroplasmavirus-related protein n=1 Tax=Spiroplasma kunkelii CR2-3x TaxID=273035 RepID=A0A0K2JGQ0_SPIKU|nr:hypothetical protein [Spiroplasma kunkelii]ALA97607.1 hypothetical protein SKUN_00716 [Spiroplasma kunkelii CR2-3x]
MKKILSLIGATAITTSGAAPLMAMMPNNQKKAPTLQNMISSTNIGYINKVSSEKIFNELKKKNERFFSKEIFIENLEIIDIFLEDKDFNYEYVNGYAEIKLKENSDIFFKKQDSRIQKVSEYIIYTINFYTKNKKYENKFRWNLSEWDLKK